MTEAWFRNPLGYIREVVECAAPLIAWDRGYAVKNKVDVVKHAELHYPVGIDFRVLAIGEQGSAEYHRGDKLSTPTAVYPTWEYGSSVELLEELLASPVGLDQSITTGNRYEDLPKDERPVWGQEHRVVIIGTPPSTHGVGRKFLRVLSNLQSEYPDCIVHLHGPYSYRVAFGMGFGAADVEVRTSASKGNVRLANGKDIPLERVSEFAQWVHLHGFTLGDMRVPRNRCMLNIKAALWAGQHWDANINFKTVGNSTVNPEDIITGSETYASIISVARPASAPHRRRVTSGDRLLCNLCSVQDECKFYREGAVCSVPGSEPASLVQLLGSRDADQIVDGLSTLLTAQAQRYATALEDENLAEELDPEVTRMGKTIFDQGVKLAKLRNPALAGGPRVGVFVSGGAVAAVATSTPQQLMAAAVAELEAKGIARADITPEMISGLLQPEATEQRNRAIAAGAAYHEDRGHILDVEEK